MAKVMMTIQTTDSAPTVEELRHRYALAEDEIDPAFGVVEVDPAQHIFTVLVEESAAAKMAPTERWKVAGPYANPSIEPFGPPRE
jgi:hypothetical protein